ncbi:MAG: hypothetical protein ABI237_00610 [Ginsengibacter sp.]
MGISHKYIIGLGFSFLLANFIYELWIPIMNTRDIVDVWYGAAGTLIGFMFLFVAKKHGIKVNTANV